AARSADMRRFDQSSNNATGMVTNSVSNTRSNQITTIFGTEIGMSVATTHGTNAEKKMICETDTTAITNLTAVAWPVTSNEGRNISAIPSADAFATNNGSPMCSSQVTG